MTVPGNLGPKSTPFFTAEGRDHEHTFAVRGRFRPAERAPEDACLARCETCRSSGPTPILRTDHGLTFRNRRSRAAYRVFRIHQAFVHYLSLLQCRLDKGSTRLDSDASPRIDCQR